MKATRRAAVAASATAALGLAGCTADGSGSPSTTSGPSTSAATEASAPDPDKAALDRAADLTAGLLAQVQGTGAGLDPGRRWANLHAAHLEVLQEAVGTSSSPSSLPPASGVPDRDRLRRRELAAQRELAGLAGAAESGALARLLASMSAGIAAHLAVPARARP